LIPIIHVESASQAYKSAKTFLRRNKIYSLDLIALRKTLRNEITTYFDVNESRPPLFFNRKAVQTYMLRNTNKD
jgi:hypothetical protein